MHRSPFQLVLQANLRSMGRRFVSLWRHSWLMVGLVTAFLGGYVVLAFGLFYQGLRFLARFPGLGGALVERLIFLLFAFLFGLLLISNLVISYSNLFRNRETTFLMTLPVPNRSIFQWKLVESTLLASWAFLFLIAPLLAAYGLVNAVAWHFYPAVVFLIGLFVVLPGSAGAWLAVHLAGYLDRKAFQIVTAVTLLLVGALILFRFRPEPIPEAELETRVLNVIDRLLDKTKFAQFPMLPSYWLSSSVQNWAEGAVRSAVFFALVLLSHALFFGTLIATRMGNAFYEASSVVQSRGSVFARWKWFQDWQERRQKKRDHREDRLGRGGLEIILGVGNILSTDVRALIAKDLRVFWRDTTQWGQTAMLFGLLSIYTVNLRHFSRQLDSPYWISMVSYLNLGACALNLATITTRFIFPQFSLEGKRVWVVGLAPLGLVRVVLLKFWLGSASTLILTLSLILLSCSMLRLDGGRTAFFAGAITLMSLTLNAVAVGMGALFPNFREQNPNKIVNGFGGTFCLVVSFVYIVGSVAMLAVGSPWGWHLSNIGDDAAEGGFNGAKAGFFWTIFTLVSVLVGWLPLRLGLRRVARTEL